MIIADQLPTATDAEILFEITRTEERIRRAENKGSKLALQKKLKRLTAVRREKLVFKARCELHNLAYTCIKYKQPVI